MKAAIRILKSYILKYAADPKFNPEYIQQALAVLEAWPKIKEVVNSEFNRINKDERYHYKPALVQVNAPLALIQCEMEGEMFILKKLCALLESLPDKE